MAKQRIGIYAGTFDPVHAGHIAFALQSMEAGKLDRVYFLPERQPRHKRGVEHFGHRVAMLDRALKPHPHLRVLELPDINFSIQRTLVRLLHLHPQDQLVFLFGSDIVPTIPDWQFSEQLLARSELIVGLRGQDTEFGMRQLIQHWQAKPQALAIVDSYAPGVSSGHIREALRLRQPVQGLLSSVVRYSDRHWLYVSLA